MLSHAPVLAQIVHRTTIRSEAMDLLQPIEASPSQEGFRVSKDGFKPQ